MAVILFFSVFFTPLQSFYQKSSLPGFTIQFDHQKLFLFLIPPSPKKNKQKKQ